MQIGVASLSAKLKAAGRRQDLAELERPSNVGRSEAAPRLRENLDALFNMIDAADAAPTEAQIRYFHQSEGQYAALLARFGDLKK